MSEADAVVVGAGVAGLVCATALARAGRRVLVLEADALPGGWCRTERRGGYLFERGPQTFRAAEGDALTRAAAWAGIAGEVVPAAPEAKRRYVLRGGALHAVPRGLLSVLSPGGVLRMLSEPLRAGQHRPGESVAAFARRRLGAEATRVLVDAGVSGVFAGDAERLELESAFPSLAAAEARHGGLFRAQRAGFFPPRQIGAFEGGMGRLSEALAEDLGEALRLGTRVLALEPPTADRPWRVHAAGDAGEEVHTAPRLALAIPAHAAAPLLAPLDPELGLLLEGIRSASVAVVGLGYDRAAFRGAAPEGFGFLAPRGEGLRALGCIYVSSLFPGAAPPGKVLLRVLLGGARDPGAVRLAPDALLARVRAELEPLLGIAREPEQVHVQRHARAIPQYEPGHAARVRAIEARAARLPGLALLGNAYRGVSVVDVAADAVAVAERWLEAAPALVSS
ncbi:MAG: protoporphyrinogen oxidase [Planctomycetota bacterium]